MGQFHFLQVMTRFDSRPERRTSDLLLPELSFRQQPHVIGGRCCTMRTHAWVHFIYGMRRRPADASKLLTQIRLRHAYQGDTSQKNPGYSLPLSIEWDEHLNYLGDEIALSDGSRWSIVRTFTPFHESYNLKPPEGRITCMCKLVKSPHSASRYPEQAVVKIEIQYVDMLTNSSLY